MKIERKWDKLENGSYQLRANYSAPGVDIRLEPSHDERYMVVAETTANRVVRVGDSRDGKPISLRLAKKKGQDVLTNQKCLFILGLMELQ